ncbi:MAG: type II toxin-antitoxin system RelE/ParE family toxin [Micropepsaceae bacterium]
MLSLSILARAVKQLAKMPRVDAQAVMGKLEAYAADRGAPVDVKPLRGEKGVLRLRHGDWRAIFEIDPKARTMVVVEVVNRRDAYT